MMIAISITTIRPRTAASLVSAIYTGTCMLAWVNTIEKVLAYSRPDGPRTQAGNNSANYVNVSDGVALNYSPPR